MGHICRFLLCNALFYKYPTISVSFFFLINIWIISCLLVKYVLISLGYLRVESLDHTGHVMVSFKKKKKPAQQFAKETVTISTLSCDV